MQIRRRIAVRLLATIGLVLGSGAMASAEPMEANGIQFSDERGGFRILSLTGTGAVDDPFVLLEEIHEETPAVLVVRGLSPNTNPFGRSTNVAGFALIKVVINGTGRSWSGFDHELRELLDQPSGYMDGLSFDQPSLTKRNFHSDRFSTANVVAEPYDTVRYRHGAVEPKERASFRLLVTDPTPQTEFFVVQTPYWPIVYLDPDSVR